ncbi:MAG: hypothetical protein QOK48_3685, partial [Blastocatellia bacterium]|nr:hypothetical protein [Blastocatellia bacterium]
WIDVVVEDVALEQVDYFGRRVNADWLFQFAEQIVNKDRQAGDVIHVRMRYDNIADLPPLSLIRRDANAAGVD